MVWCGNVRYEQHNGLQHERGKLRAPPVCALSCRAIRKGRCRAPTACCVRTLQRNMLPQTYHEATSPVEASGVAARNRGLLRAPPWSCDMPRHPCASSANAARSRGHTSECELTYRYLRTSARVRLQGSEPDKVLKRAAAAAQQRHVYCRRAGPRRLGGQRECKMHAPMHTSPHACREHVCWCSGPR